MLLELLWRLLNRSPRENFKVYRVIEQQEGVFARSLVFENIKQTRFIEQSYFSDSSNLHTSHLYDALNAMSSLNLDMPLALYDTSWNTEGASSIDEAIDKAAAVREQRLMKAGHSQFPEARKPERKGLRAHLTVKEIPVKDATIEEQSRKLSSDLRRKAGGKTVQWKAIESTAGGRECQLLVVE